MLGLVSYIALCRCDGMKTHVSEVKMVLRSGPAVLQGQMLGLVSCKAVKICQMELYVSEVDIARERGLAQPGLQGQMQGLVSYKALITCNQMETQVSETDIMRGSGLALPQGQVLVLLRCISLDG